MSISTPKPQTGLDLRARIAAELAAMGEDTLRLFGLIEAVSVISLRGGFPNQVANAVARSLWETAATLAPADAEEARRWANERERVLRFEKDMAALAAARHELMKDHADAWVVLADGAILGFAEGFHAAATIARELRPDGTALVAPVDERFEMLAPDPERWGRDATD